MITVLLATALVSATSAVLSALLLVAERYLVNYGTCVIDINQGARIAEVTGGDTLLNSLMSQDIFIPSACGGRGTCAFCKLQVLDGGGPVAPTELPLLTEQEAADNVRISCQVKVRNDLAILIPDALFSIRQYHGIVERIRDLTRDIKELCIRLIEPETISFVPGQYVQLHTPPYGSSREPVYRAYSVSSIPADDRCVELIVRLVPGGICTTWVFTLLKEGDEVTFNGPYGDFRLTDSDRRMVWIAGGSGMAPFWSIIRHMRATGAGRPCTYFFGALQQQDMLLLEELQQLAKELPWFTYVPALSDPAEGNTWDGETGLITEVVERHVTDAEAEVYLCGGSGMIDAAIKVISAKGIPEERIFYDKFN